MNDQDSTLKFLAIIQASKKIYDKESHKINSANCDEKMVLSYLTHFNKLGVKGIENISFPENFKLSKV